MHTRTRAIGATGSTLMMLLWGGCMQQPFDGETTSSAFGTTLTFSGVYDSKNIPIQIQVLDAPDSNANRAWKPVGSNTVTSATPSYYPTGSTPYYQWSVSLTPADGSASGKARWPTGGLVHVRAVALDPAGHGANYVLDVSDEDADACYGAHPNDDWFELINDCGKDPTFGAAVADNSVTPDDATSGHAPPPYLTRRAYTGQGITDPSGGPNGIEIPILDLNAFTYYARVGMPATLHDFQSRFGFLDGTGNPVSAIYYNFGDLGIGRNMNCASKGGTTACFVSNFAPTSGGKLVFGDESDSLALATSGATPFATVAMTFTAPASAPDAVKFVVYDSTGHQQGHAQLDRTGDNIEVPGNCLSCHGGSAPYDPTTASVAPGAHFLPFDLTNSIHCSGDSPFTCGDQSEKFRKLNQLVLGAGATPAMSDFINGSYDQHLGTVGQAQDPSWVAPGWTTSAATTRLYTSVVAPYCRSCHSSNSSFDAQGKQHYTTFDWSSFDSFSAQAAGIIGDVCGKGAHVMPHAEQTLVNFWNGPARAHLTAGLDVFSSCNPL